MSATAYPPNWHPDPNLPPGSMRWWDGNQWTQHVHVPATVQHVPPAMAPAASVAAATAAPAANVTAPPMVSAAASVPPATYAAASGGAPAATFGASAATFGASAATLSTPGLQQPGAPSASPSLLDTNPKSVTAIGVVVAYLVIAATTGIVFLGIFPVLLSIRAFQRGERLAPVAMAAAALAVFVALSAVSHH